MAGPTADRNRTLVLARNPAGDRRTGGGSLATAAASARLHAGLAHDEPTRRTRVPDSPAPQHLLRPAQILTLEMNRTGRHRAAPSGCCRRRPRGLEVLLRSLDLLSMPLSSPINSTTVIPPGPLPRRPRSGQHVQFPWRRLATGSPVVDGAGEKRALAAHPVGGTDPPGKRPAAAPDRSRREWIRLRPRAAARPAEANQASPGRATPNFVVAGQPSLRRRSVIVMPIMSARPAPARCVRQPVRSARRRGE